MCCSISAGLLLQGPLNYSQAQTAVMDPGGYHNTKGHCELMYCISSYRTLFQRFSLLKPLKEDKAWRPWGDTKCWVTFQSFHDVYLIPHQKLAVLRKKQANTKKNPALYFLQILSRSHRQPGLALWYTALVKHPHISQISQREQQLRRSKTKVCVMSRINTVCYKLESSCGCNIDYL